MAPRYHWPEDLTERGSLWHNYQYENRWTHSLLWAETGELIATCEARMKRDGWTLDHVIWHTEFVGDEWQADTRRDGKLAARRECREFLDRACED